MIQRFHIPRRQLLKTASSGALLVALAGSRAWAAVSDSERRKRLVVVFLRGAVDGLNVVVPYGDSNYSAVRPTLALAAPGGDKSVLDLDGHFGLHPALAPVMPLWQEKSLAFVHATGSPDPTRSHFDAQDYMESGTPGIKTTPDGWMNRLLGALPRPHQAIAALAFGPTLPRILSGHYEVANIPLGRSANAPIPLDRPGISASFDNLYAGNDSMSLAYREGIESHRKVMTALTSEMLAADNGAPSPVGFNTDTDHLAEMVKADPSIDLAFFALGGWDTHVNQGAADGQLANHLKPLGEGLVALARGLGPAYGDTVILVISEFGRTVHENGNRGTDHGHGNVMWVMGGPIAGGKVYGTWPGLAPDALYQGRDLPVTTDFRSVIATVLSRHMGIGAAAMEKVFPALPAAPHLDSIVSA